MIFDDFVNNYETTKKQSPEFLGNSLTLTYAYCMLTKGMNESIFTF